MKRALFDRSGHYLIGTKKGTHARGLPESYVTWASENIDGFKEQFEAAKKIGQEEKRPATGRTYTISRTKRMFERREPQDAISFDDLHGCDTNPPTAFDIGGDF